MIKIDTVSKTFGKGKDAFTALRDVSLNILQNEFFTLLGPSGCGKTTLLRAIAGFVDPTEGRITLEGQDLLLLPPFSRPVNTVFQNYALFPHMSVAENIAFGLEMQNKPKSEVTQTVNEMLQLVQMADMAKRKPSQISGGQQQRVALARALAPRPKVLLLDEPLSALDFKLRKEMQVELKRLQAETGITFVFVTHDQEEALTMSDRIAVMHQGQILQVDNPRTVYDHPAERFVADFIGDSNFLEADVVSADDVNTEIRLSSGATVLARRPEGGASVGRVTIAVRPEHASFCAQADALLTGWVTNVVYSGTDTHYHLLLNGDSRFVVRLQNRPDAPKYYTEGCAIGVKFGPGVAQILRD